MAWCRRIDVIDSCGSRKSPFVRKPDTKLTRRSVLVRQLSCTAVTGNFVWRPSSSNLRQTILNPFAVALGRAIIADYCSGLLQSRTS